MNAGGKCKAWGGIVNQSRTLAIAGLSFGPEDRAWRERFVRWSAAFCHASRANLRGERDVPELVRLLGQEDARRVTESRHMPNTVSLELSMMLEEACRRGEMDRFAFMGANREKATLIDHIGVCERIMKTPLAMVFAIKARRFILLFMITLPIALLHKFAEAEPLLVTIITMLVAYPVLGLDQIGVELQQPFFKGSLSHLPLDDICATIEGDLLAMLDQGPPEEEFKATRWAS